MRNRLLTIVFFIMFVAMSVTFSGCAGTFCSNAPSVTSNLQTAVDTLKSQVVQLQGTLLNGYDVEIEMAYLAAKVALSGAQILLKQWCPDPIQVADVVKNAELNITPKVLMAHKRAIKLGFVKP